MIAFIQMRAGDHVDAEHAAFAREVAHAVRRDLRLTSVVEDGDLEGYAFQGLLEARERFDPEKGIAFKTFAQYRVRGAVLDGLRKMNALPPGAYHESRRLAALDLLGEEALHEREEEQPATEILGAAAALDRFVQGIGAALAASAALEAPAGRTPEEALITEIEHARLRKAVGGLDEREAIVVRGMYFEGRSLDELGAQLGVSRSMVSRIHTGALRVLAKRLVS